MGEVMSEYKELAKVQEGLKLIEYYSFSILKLFQRDVYSEMLSDWKKASMLLYLFTVRNCTDKIFPLEINEQLEYIIYPINDWGIGYYSELDGVDMPLLFPAEGEWFTTELAIELANQYQRNPGAQDLEKIKNIVRDAGLNNKIYTCFRELLVRNAVILEDSLPCIKNELNNIVDNDSRYALEQFCGTSDLMDIFEDQYIEVHPSELNNEQLELCPYCGYILSTRNKRNFAGVLEVHYSCLSPKCLLRKDVNKKKLLLVSKGKRCFKLKKQVMFSVVLPGIIEIELYDKLRKANKNKNYEVILYPGADKADIIVKFKDGITWAIDAKDWINPNALANNLNIKGFMKGIFNDPNFNISKGYLILPNDSTKEYKNVLKAKWEKANCYEVLSIKEFLKIFQRRISNEGKF